MLRFMNSGDMSMELKELATSLGIEDYPEKLEKIYENLPEDDGSLYNVEYIRELEAKYGLLGEYLDDVIKGAEDIKDKKNLLLWARLVYEYNKDSTLYEIRKLKLPETDGSPAMDMLPVLVLLREVPDTVKRYEARGFNDKQIIKNLENFKINLWVLQLLRGRPMLAQGHYKWLCNYTKALIFDHKAFNFQPSVWGTNAIVLKNKITGEHVMVMLKGTFHRNGLVLGSAGCEDAEGSFNAVFSETLEVFIGHAAIGGRVQTNAECFKKTEWECVLRPGDAVVSLHIPRKTNLDHEYVSESLREGLELTKKYYPEISPKYINCSSWLLEPMLATILGENAKLSKFTNRFLKHPILDYGTGCLGYVWPGNSGPVESYEENTSLQRGIKKLLLEGDFIRGHAGVIVDEL